MKETHSAPRRPSKHSRPIFRALACAALLALGACGGGGGGDDGDDESVGPSPASPAAGGGGGGASPTPIAAKIPWNVSTAASFFLQASGVPVTGPLTCTSQAPQALEVAANCSSVKGLRLGVYAVTVSGGGASAPALVKVTPPPRP